MSDKTKHVIYIILLVISAVAIFASICLGFTTICYYSQEKAPVIGFIGMGVAILAIVAAVLMFKFMRSKKHCPPAIALSALSGLQFFIIAAVALGSIPALGCGTNSKLSDYLYQGGDTKERVIEVEGYGRGVDEEEKFLNFLETIEFTGANPKSINEELMNNVQMVNYCLNRDRDPNVYIYETGIAVYEHFDLMGYRSNYFTFDIADYSLILNAAISVISEHPFNEI